MADGRWLDGTMAGGKRDGWNKKILYPGTVPTLGTPLP